MLIETCDGCGAPREFLRKECPYCGRVYCFTEKETETVTYEVYATNKLKPEDYLPRHIMPTVKTS